MRIPTHSRRGATLIEAVSSILVLGIAIPPLLFLFTEVSHHSVDDTRQGAALGLAEALLEEIVSQAFEDPEGSSGSFGTEEASRADYDDVDDYDGLSNSPPERHDGVDLDDYGGFTRSVVVENVTPADPDPTTAAADGSTDLKRIRVTVAWNDDVPREVVLTTLRSLTDSSGGGGGGPTGPLDEPASVATAYAHPSADDMHVFLVSISAVDVVLESFSLTSTSSDLELEEVQLDDEEIWEGDLDVPTGTVMLNEGSTSDRTVEAGDDPDLEFDFDDSDSGTVTYTVVLNFTDGSSSTLEFTLDW